MIYLKLFWTFFKIGAFTFGGGYAMLPLIQQEVLSNGWLTMEDIVDFIAVSESTPGPFAVNISTYIGMQTGGIGGALAATGGVVLPSFIIILIVAGIYERFKKSRLVKGAMTGLRPTVVGLIGTAVVTTAVSAFSQFFTSSEIFIGLLLFVVMFVALLKKLNPILIIIASAVVGILIHL